MAYKSKAGKCQLTNRGGCKRVPTPPSQVDVLDILRKYIKNTGVTKCFDFGTYRGVASGQAVRGAGLLKMQDLLLALRAGCPQLLFKPGDLKQAVWQLAGEFDGLKNNDRPMDRWASDITERVLVLCNHLRRLANSEVRMRQAISPLDKESAGQLQALAAKVVLTPLREEEQACNLRPEHFDVLDYFLTGQPEALVNADPSYAATIAYPESHAGLSQVEEARHADSDCIHEQTRESQGQPLFAPTGHSLHDDESLAQDLQNMSPPTRKNTKVLKRPAAASSRVPAHSPAAQSPAPVTPAAVRRRLTRSFDNAPTAAQPSPGAVASPAATPAKVLRQDHLQLWATYGSKQSYIQFSPNQNGKKSLLIAVSEKQSENHAQVVGLMLQHFQARPSIVVTKQQAQELRNYLLTA